MKILSIELQAPTPQRQYQALAYLGYYLGINFAICALTNGSIKAVIASAITCLPLLVLWTFGWNPFKQGFSSWVLGIVIFIPSAVVTNLIAI